MSEYIFNSPISLGNTLIKNRIAFPPLGCNWADQGGFVNEKIINHYREISRGGSGMVIVEGTSVSPEGNGTTNGIGLYNDSYLPGIKLILSELKKEKCFSSIQLLHSGGQANPNFTGHQPISPSGTTCNATGFPSHEMNLSEIEEIKNKFVYSAKLAASAGFDAVELHLAHGYLLHQFLSPYTNHRNDKYGGNLENRARLITDIIHEIKIQNPSLLLGARISGEDYIPSGINNEMNKTLLPLLENSGINYFSVTAGIYDTSKLKHEAMMRGDFFKYSKEIKEIVNVPVIGVGKILDLLTAEKHLYEQSCDIVAIGRGMLADPYMLKKFNRKEDYNRCSECNHCAYLRFGKKSVTCPVRGLE